MLQWITSDHAMQNITVVRPQLMQLTQSMQSRCNLMVWVLDRSSIADSVDPHIPQCAFLEGNGRIEASINKKGVYQVGALPTD
ncbi:MAG: hypothetical protein B0A82_05840 [Alkalinema sp. CACIAM 70d]|nr:MAG: hypothetical protein B0A82_05840 [Alkalinema sp. CACIAM 70d]